MRERPDGGVSQRPRCGPLPRGPPPPLSAFPESSGLASITACLPAPSTFAAAGRQTSPHPTPALDGYVRQPDATVAWGVISTKTNGKTSAPPFPLFPVHHRDPLGIPARTAGRLLSFNPPEMLPNEKRESWWSNRSSSLVRQSSRRFFSTGPVIFSAWADAARSFAFFFRHAAFGWFELFIANRG